MSSGHSAAARVANQFDATNTALLDEDQSVPSFIGKLHQMLQDPTAQRFVAWSPSGIILNQTQFSSQILPRFFKHSNIASFVRQLNLYGFHKSSQEAEACEFSHPIFRQGNEHLFKDIRRKVATQCDAHQVTAPKSEWDKMMQNIEELKSRQVDFGESLKQKEAEKEIIHGKHRQDDLEDRMDRMIGALEQTCKYIGLKRIDGEGGNLLQIHEEDVGQIRNPKRQKLLRSPICANARAHKGLTEAFPENSQTKHLKSKIVNVKNALADEIVATEALAEHRTSHFLLATPKSSREGLSIFPGLDTTNGTENVQISPPLIPHAPLGRSIVAEEVGVSRMMEVETPMDDVDIESFNPSPLMSPCGFEGYDAFANDSETIDSVGELGNQT